MLDNLNMVGILLSRNDILMLISVYLEMERLAYKTQYLIQDILVYRVLSDMKCFCSCILVVCHIFKLNILVTVTHNLLSCECTVMYILTSSVFIFAHSVFQISMLR